MDHSWQPSIPDTDLVTHFYATSSARWALPGGEYLGVGEGVDVQPARINHVAPGVLLEVCAMEPSTGAKGPSLQKQPRVSYASGDAGTEAWLLRDLDEQSVYYILSSLSCILRYGMYLTDKSIIETASKSKL